MKKQTNYTFYDGSTVVIDYDTNIVSEEDVRNYYDSLNDLLKLFEK